jgi:cytochrome c biogenesis protein CcdA
MKKALLVAVFFVVFSTASAGVLLGDRDITSGIQNAVVYQCSSNCPLLSGPVEFSSMNFSSLPAYPTIWSKDRILIRKGSGYVDNDVLRSLVFGNISEALQNVGYTQTEPEVVYLSGSQEVFENAVDLGSWIFQWNGDGSSSEVVPVCGVYFTGVGCPHCAIADPVVFGTTLESNDNLVIIEYEVYQHPSENAQLLSDYSTKYGFAPGIPVLIFSDGNANNTCVYNASELTIPKIVSLAAVDAVNPCALAVLTFMLLSIITYNPKNKRNIILAGMAFVSSVFVMYMFYGLVIIRFFQLVQALTSIRLFLYKFLGLAAIILGILQIKDFVRYKPGGILTEMPISMRPKLQKLMGEITSPKGAFAIGFFVTVFLLPCTIGPYVIAGGILSAMEILSTIPWLVLYNIIFVLPMVAITFIVYEGISTVENVTKWRKDNVRYLHGVAGTIILILGVAMLFGLV